MICYATAKILFKKQLLCVFQGPQHVPASSYHSRKDEEEKTFQYVQLAINMLPMHIQMPGGPQVARWPDFSSSDFGPFFTQPISSCTN